MSFTCYKLKRRLLVREVFFFGVDDERGIIRGGVKLTLGDGGGAIIFGFTKDNDDGMIFLEADIDDSTSSIACSKDLTHNSSLILKS